MILEIKKQQQQKQAKAGLFWCAGGSSLCFELYVDF